MSRKITFKLPFAFWLLMLASLVWSMHVVEGAPASAVQVGGPTDGGALEQSADRLVQEQLRMIETGSVETYWTELMTEYGGYFPGGKMPSFMELVQSGGNGIKLADMLKALLQFILHEVLYNGKLLAAVVLLTVFSMILETLQTAFERKAVSKVAYAVSYMVLIILAVNSFYVAIGYAKEAIGGMIQFMMAMIPLLLALLASMGNVVTVSVMHPLIIFMIHTVGTLIHSIVFPLLFFSAVLHIASAISDRFKVTQLADLIRKCAVGLLGLLLTIFLGVISVQGASGGVTDGITLKTAKFVTGNFVPVVGRAFSDAADTVLSASLLVKNAVGIAGVVILLFLCAFPAVKILALALIYNICAAVLQPLGDSPIIGCLETIGKTMIYVFAALAAVGLMFFLAVTIILTAGNAAVMLR